MFFSYYSIRLVFLYFPDTSLVAKIEKLASRENKLLENAKNSKLNYKLQRREEERSPRKQCWSHLQDATPPLPKNTKLAPVWRFKLKSVRIKLKQPLYHSYLFSP